MNSDYYAILGVPRSASQAELKAAYVRLSKTLHPDVNPNGQALMQVVNEAYGVLSDVQKRAAYDRGEKLRPFPREKKVGCNPNIPAGTVDLTKLAQAFIPSHVYQAAGPSLERLLKDRGISPQAASMEQVLESFGVLKKKRGKKSA